jgi:hypothetical protein
MSGEPVVEADSIETSHGCEQGNKRSSKCGRQRLTNQTLGGYEFRNCGSYFLTEASELVDCVTQSGKPLEVFKNNRPLCTNAQYQLNIHMTLT